MENQLNNTQPGTNTSNPQSAPAPGASNAADFQSTAPSNALGQNTQNLSVEQTGEPLTGTQAADSTNYAPYLWGGGIIVVIILSVILFVKLFQDSVEESEPELRAATAAKPRATAASKSVKKSTKKKSAPNQRRKKQAKKRR